MVHLGYRKIVGVLACLFIALISFSYGQVHPVFRAGSTSAGPSDTGVLNSTQEKIPGKMLKHQRSSNANISTVSRVQFPWTFDYTDGVADYYFDSGVVGDTFAVMFTPSAPVIVQSVESQWYTPGVYSVFAARYNPVADSLYPEGYITADEPGDSLPSPIGELLTPVYIDTVDSTYEWASVEMDTFLVNTGETFVIGFMKHDSSPLVLLDSGHQGTHTWFGGDWTNHQWETINNHVEMMVRVHVEYGEQPTPALEVQQMPDTYRQSGIFHATALVMTPDNNPESFNIRFQYSIGPDRYTPATDTVEIPFADFVATGEEHYYTVPFSIDEIAPGSVFRYRLISRFYTYVFTSNTRYFTIQEPSYPDADLLLIYDDPTGTDLDRSSVYKQVLDEAGVVYEYWNASPGVRNGIDSSVINFGWDNIIFAGLGSELLPATTGDDDSGFATFLDSGGNLFYSDQDYFYAHGLDATGIFSPGEFAYEYFGIGDYTNDPADKDSLFLGLAGVGSDFSADPYSLEGGFQIWDIAGNNWSDFFSADAATGIFLGQNDGQNYGVQYDLSSGGTTIYLGFMAEANVDSLEDGTIVPGDQFTTLINAVVNTFGVSSPPMITGAAGPTGTVLSGPYDVSATITDADGDAISATVKYSSDGGDTWTDVAMSADGDMYTAQIPDQSQEGFYYWYIEAAAGGDVSTYPSADMDPAMFERFVATAPTLVYFNGGSPDGYPGAYYFGKGDFTNYTTVNFAHDTWTKALTAELVAEYTSIYEITTFGPNYDNRTVITDWLASGEKNYFLAGDEWLGVLSNWTDMDFSAGDFEYDVLGLTHSYNDISYYYHNGSGAPSPIEAVDGNVLTGELYTEHTAAGDTLLYDPAYEIEADNWLDAFEVIDEANTHVNMTSDTTLWDATTALPIGVNREVNDDKVVFLGFDPLSINATPYTWWGFSEFSPQTKSFDWFGIETAVEGEKTIPQEFSLSQNYPNPFNPVTRIFYYLPERVYVNLSVYNLRGERVAVLVNEVQEEGAYIVPFPEAGHQLSSGMYIYRITIPGDSKCRKMIYLK